MFTAFPFASILQSAWLAKNFSLLFPYPSPALWRDAAPLYHRRHGGGALLTGEIAEDVVGGIELFIGAGGADFPALASEGVEVEGGGGGAAGEVEVVVAVWVCGGVVEGSSGEAVQRVAAARVRMVGRWKGGMFIFQGWF